MTFTGRVCPTCLAGERFRDGCPECWGAGYVMQCESCDGSGIAYTMNDETEIGCAPGSSAIPCPDCGQAAEALARRFHETYERLAPSFGYKTREESAVPWEEVLERNQRLMIAVCAEILRGAAGNRHD